jgi:integrase
MSGEGSTYVRKDGRWVSTIRIPGRPMVTLYAPTKTAVLEKRRVAEHRLEQGLPATDKSVTVDTLFEEWLASVRLRRSAGTLRYYTTVCKTHILPVVGGWTVSTLQPKDIDHLVSLAAEQGYSNSTVRRVRTVMVSVLKFAITRHYCSVNVAAMTETVPEEHKEGRTLSPEQARTLLAAFNEHERFGAAFSLMLGLGCRRSEVLNLRWTDVNLDPQHPSIVVHGHVKTKASIRTIDLPEFVRASLVSHRSRHPGISDALVFTNTLGRAQDPGKFYTEFVRTAQEALGEHINPHLMRHTAASLMLASGVTLEVVSRVLGHSKVATTADLYSHLLPAAYRDAAEKMNQMVGTR